MFDTYDLAPSRVSVAGMLAREFGIEVLSSPPLCSAYVYVMADVDLFASGHRAWLYIGSRGNVTGALFDPMADGYTGSGAAWTETHSDNLLKFIVSTFSDRDGAYDAEEALLRRIDATGHPEFFNDKNAGRGTDGSLMSRPDVRARHAAAVITPEYRAKMKSIKGTPEARAINAALQTVAQNRPEVVAKKREAALTRLAQPEARDAISLATREAMARPDIVEKIARHRSTPEYKAAYSAKHKARWANPEAAARNRAAIMAGWADPVKRAARLEKCAATRAAKLKGDAK